MTYRNASPPPGREEKPVSKPKRRTTREPRIPAWAREIREDVERLKRDVDSLRRQVGIAAFVGAALAEAIQYIATHTGQ